MDTDVVVRIYIVRHGETEANRTGILQGQMDTQLNEAGVAQAWEAARALEGVQFGAAYTSDLSRAVKTAEIILSKHPGVALQQCKDLRERYFGDMEGKKMGEREMWVIPANAEATDAFSSRALSWWKKTVVQRHVQARESGASSSGTQELEGGAEDLVSNTGDAGQAIVGSPQKNTTVNILVVSHGGLIDTLAVGLLGSRQLRSAEGVAVGRCMNAGISVVELRASGKGVLVSYGDTTHLKGELVVVNVDEVGSGSDGGR